MSERAENFLRKLIVINPEERYGWKQLFEDKYLTENVVSDDFYPSKCMLPLEEKSWQDILVYLESLIKWEKDSEGKRMDSEEKVEEAHIS